MLKHTFCHSPRLSVTDEQSLWEEGYRTWKDIVWSEFCEYVDQVLEVEDDFYMSNSWCTLQKKGGSHPYHNHPGSIFSSTYYAQAHNGSLSFSTPELSDFTLI